MQASSGLLYDVFARYDPDNLLLLQAHPEVLERQLERSRLGRTLERIAGGRITVADSEKFLDRVKRLAATLGRSGSSGDGSGRIRFGRGRGRGFR